MPICRCQLARLVFGFLSGRLLAERLAGPNLLADDAQRHRVQIERNERVKEGSAACFAVHRPGSGDLLDGAGQVDFGGNLHQQHEVLAGDSLIGCLDMGLEDFLGRCVGVIAEAVDGIELSFGIESGGQRNVWFLQEGSEYGERVERQFAPGVVQNFA